jgi:hypothetical protein
VCLNNSSLKQEDHLLVQMENNEKKSSAVFEPEWRTNTSIDSGLS